MGQPAPTVTIESHKASRPNTASDEPRFVPVQTRSERFTSVDAADFPALSSSQLEWKYTPITRVKALAGEPVNGARYEYTVTDETGDALLIEWLDRTDRRIGAAGKPEERVSANAWTSFSEALAITVPAGADGGLTVDRNRFGPEARAAHTVITAGTGSRAVLIVQNSGSALLTENLEIVLEDEAQLTVVSVQEWADDAIHLASHFATLGRGARLKHVVISLGGSVVRIDPSVHLAATGSDAELLGVYFADAGQHLEQRVFVNHDAPHTRSRVNYRGALQGEGARTAWVGDVLIRATAVAADTYEQNRNLVLTEGARADSVPNLEIETGDILAAGHASTTGRFDDEQLFYLRSRGIPEAEARRLVVRGFFTELIASIGQDALEARLVRAIETELGMPASGPPEP
ncbi:Fe-S cluster assembly protein SufD [Homoserinimonas sp. OAct 916]|uniref:Fe-S cluster assembly protein SufD n=1 Tax=Homoserinimonas sp. OAct 916 TaxID=2211450 RepID=UPI000DBE0CB8|nr:Fe-S cluster assembly protein SufD [Homoserinimonas sp. OAct 916]